MNPVPTEHFSQEQVLKLRREIEGQGIVPDPFLAADPDRPVFGLNLACCWPFPSELEKSYKSLADKLTALDPGVYVYPFRATHITLITFANFTLQRRPQVELEALIPRIIACLNPVLSSGKNKPFDLDFQAPVLTRKAAILPIINRDGQVASIRQRVLQQLQSDTELYDSVVQAGLNIPNIIHSTIMRFRSAPADLNAFLASFEGIAAGPTVGSVIGNEIFLTSETKPYMREGKILQVWPLSS